jgi:arabinogalactan oligomer/maltooligosaccharide transport system permease protein
LIDLALLLVIPVFIYWIGSQLTARAALSPRLVTFMVSIYGFLTPFYFYRGKKLHGTIGDKWLGIQLVENHLHTTLNGDQVLLRSLLVNPIWFGVLVFLFFPRERMLLQSSPWAAVSFKIWAIWGILNGAFILFDSRGRAVVDKIFQCAVVDSRLVKATIFESRRETKSFSYIILTLFSIFSIYPILQVFSISIRPGDRLLSKSLAIIPENATFHTYYELFFNQPFLRWLTNSLLISVAVTVVGVTLAATAGYAFSRYKFVGRNTAMVGLITTQMFPATMLLLPLFIMLIKIGAYDSYFGLIIAYSATALPFTIWQMKGYYDTIPISLEEAANIDGCSQFNTFWQIILPLSTPALAITALFSFMTAWSEYLVAAVLIQDKNLFTLPLGLKLFQSAMQTSWGLYSAGAVVVSIPVILVFLFLSRWLVSGLTLGSVKG